MKKEKGVSLIALVITIIVLIILAGAVILSGGFKIADKANEAVEKNNIAVLKDEMAIELAHIQLEYGLQPELEFVKDKLIEKGYDVTDNGDSTLTIKKGEALVMIKDNLNILGVQAQSD